MGEVAGAHPTSTSRTTDKPVVLGVCADPEPDEVSPALDREGSIMETHPGGPESTDLPEMQRGVMRIGSEQGETGVGQSADVLG